MDDIRRTVLERWQRLEDWLHALQPRERVLVTAAMAGVLLMLGDYLFLQPLQASARDMHRQQQAVQQQVAQLQLQEADLIRQVSFDPDQQLRDQLKELQRRQQQAEARIETRTERWVSPQRMAEVLRELLADRGRLQLVELGNMPTQTLEPADATNPQQNTTTGPDKAALPIYVHGVKLVLEGGYVELVRYLDALAEYDWQLQWDVLDYRVVRHPQARIELRLRTLSLRPELVGV